MPGCVANRFLDAVFNHFDQRSSTIKSVFDCQLLVSDQNLAVKKGTSELHR